MYVQSAIQLCSFHMLAPSFKLGFQLYVNQKLPDVQPQFRKGRGARDQIASIRWIMEKARKFQKKSTSASLTMLKLLCASQQTVETF